MNILFWCDNFKILNTVICFVLVLMIDLHTLWNRTNMSHIHQAMNQSLFILIFIIV